MRVCVYMHVSVCVCVCVRVSVYIGTPKGATVHVYIVYMYSLNNHREITVQALVCL